MSFMDLAKNRYSCRAFTAQAVESEKLAQVLEAGRLSPTAINAQPVTVKVIKSPEALEKIRGITRMAYNAPVVLMVCYDEPKCYTRASFARASILRNHCIESLGSITAFVLSEYPTGEV